MFRIQFTADDLIRTRFTLTYGPLAETLFGLALATQRPRTVVNDWHRRRLAAGGHWGGPVLQVAELCGLVDLLTLAGAAPTLDEGLEALIAARPEFVKAEVSAGLDLLVLRSRQAGRRLTGAPAWWPLGRDLSDDRAARRGLVDVLRTCADATVGPHWGGIRDHLAQEVARRSQQMAAEGLGRVLATLHPGFRWQSPVLELDWGPPDQVSEIDLRGRGLELVPSVLYREITPPYNPLGDDAAPRVLFYPAPIEAHQAIRIFAPTDRDDHDRALADLLGRSRALVLRCLADGCGTTELARRTGLSLAGASQHAAVLRNANLVVTNREGGAVRHRLTALGYQLLEGA